MIKLDEQKIIDIIREEWSNLELTVEKSLKTFMKIRGEEKDIISPDTKVRHSGSKLLYTVHEVLPDAVVLKTPEGKLFSIDEKEFASEYELY